MFRIQILTGCLNYFAPHTLYAPPRLRAVGEGSGALNERSISTPTLPPLYSSFPYIEIAKPATPSRAEPEAILRRLNEPANHGVLQKSLIGTQIETVVVEDKPALIRV